LTNSTTRLPCFSANFAYLAYALACATCLEVFMNYHSNPSPAPASPKLSPKSTLNRYLNEPEESESICRDILAVDPKQQLGAPPARTFHHGQFTGCASDRYGEVEEIFQKLADPYERLYYTASSMNAAPKLGLASAKSRIRCFRSSNAHCKIRRSRKIRPTGNDDAILRWNRCVRLLQTPSLTWEEQLASFEADDAPPV